MEKIDVFIQPPVQAVLLKHLSSEDIANFSMVCTTLKESIHNNRSMFFPELYVRQHGRHKAMVLACKRGHLDVLRHLHSSWNDANTWKHVRSNALKIACKNGHLALVEYLIDIMESELQEIVPILLELACANGHLAIVQYLVQTSHIVLTSVAGRLVRSSCAGGHLSVVQYLYEVGFTVGDFRRANCMALRFACKGGHLPVVQFLHEIGFTVGDFTLYNNKALRLACTGGYLPLVRYICEVVGIRTADLDQVFFECIVSLDHLAVLKYLLNRKMANFGNVRHLWISGLGKKNSTKNYILSGCGVAASDKLPNEVFLEDR